MLLVDRRLQAVVDCLAQEQNQTCHDSVARIGRVEYARNVVCEWDGLRCRVRNERKSPATDTCPGRDTAINTWRLRRLCLNNRTCANSPMQEQGSRYQLTEATD